MGMSPFMSEAGRMGKFPFIATTLEHKSLWISFSSADFQVTQIQIRCLWQKRGAGG